MSNRYYNCMSVTLPLLREDSKSVLADSTQFKPARHSLLSANYDPSAYPPDLDFARQHGHSQRIGCYVGPLQDVLRCRCCLQPINKSPLSLTCALEQLSHCGESTPLYFHFIKQTLLLLLFNVLLITIPSTIINLSTGTSCVQLVNSNDAIFLAVCRSSVLNIMNVDTIASVQDQGILNFTAIMVSILLIAYLEVRIEAKIYSSKPKAVDYSVILQGLPKDLTLEEIRAFVEDKLLYIGAPDTQIEKIYLLYDFKLYQTLFVNKRIMIEGIVKHTCRRNKLLAEINLAKELKVVDRMRKQINNEGEIINELENKLELIEIEIVKFQECTGQLAASLCKESKLSENSTIIQFSGKCIVTLNNRVSKEVLVKSQGQRSLWQWLSYKISLFLQNKKSTLVIWDAPQPSDIIFSNLGSKPQVALLNKLFFALCLFFILILDMVLITLTKKFLKQQTSVQKQNIIIFSFINSTIVALFCFLLRRIINSFEADSFHETKPQQKHAVTVMMVRVFMINMLITTFFANVVSFYLFQEQKATYEVFPVNLQAFLMDAFFMCITNPIFSLLITYFDIRQLLKWIKRHRIERELPVTQLEANIAYENMQLDLSIKYSNVFRFAIFGSAVSMLWPMALVTAIIAVGGFYWVDKALLLRRYTLSDKISAKLTMLNQRMLGLIPLYMSVVNFIIMFVHVMNEETFSPAAYSSLHYYLASIAVIVSVAAYFIGNQLLKKVIVRLWGSKDSGREQNNAITYREIQSQLSEDFSHHYPYFRVRGKIKEREIVREDKIRELKESQKIGVFAVIRSYLDQKRYTQNR